MDIIKTSSGTTLGVPLACKRLYTARKIITEALDGTPYIQTTGNAGERREVHIFCDTSSKRDATDRASNNGAKLLIEWQGSTIHGYIEEDVEWREWKDGHGVGMFTLIVLEVVSE